MQAVLKDNPYKFVQKKTTSSKKMDSKQRYKAGEKKSREKEGKKKREEEEKERREKKENERNF